MMPPEEVPRVARAVQASVVDASRCRACARVHVPARRWRCLGCGGRDLAVAQVPLRGRLESFTRIAKGPRDAGLALVRLDAGPMVTASLLVEGLSAEVGAAVTGWAEPLPGGGQRLRFALVERPPAALGAAEA